MLINWQHFNICDILKFGRFHINDNFNLINTLLIHELFTVCKLHPPCMFKFFYEKVYQFIYWVTHSLHQLLKFDLTYLHNENGTSALINTVKSTWTKVFNFIKLLKIVLQYGIYILFLSPLEIILQLIGGHINVKFVWFQKPCIKMLIK